MKGGWVVLAGLAIAGVSFGVGPALSLGQDAADTTVVAHPVEDSLKVYAVPEILVTASRLPAKHPAELTNVAVATAADLAELASSTVAEGLAADPGTGLTRYGSYGSLQTMSLRGGGSGEVIYLLDGVPLSDPQVSAIDLNWLPMAGTSRVEAMKGGGSAIYGSGAISGAVNVVSMDALADIPSSRITWWTGGFGSKAASASLRRAIAGKLGVLAAYDYSKSDGWITNSAYRGDKYYGKLTAALGADSKLDAVGFTYNGDIEVPGTFPGLEKDRRRFYNLSLAGTGDEGFTAGYYHSTSYQVYTSDSEIYGRSVYRHAGGLDGLQIEAYRRSGDHEATSLGAGVERKHVDSNSVGKRSASDVYGFFQKEVSEGPVSLSGSLRLEKSSMFRLEAAPQATGRFAVGRGLSLFTKIDRSFMYPSFNDLYWKGPDEEGDPDLRTERSRGFELGAHLDRGAMKAGLAAYYRDVTDLILWRTDAACLPTKSTNAQARLKGLEGSLRLEPVRGVEASLSYALMSAVDDAGNALVYKSPYVFTWNAKADHAFSKHISCGLVFSGRNVAKVKSGSQFDYAAMTCLEDTSLPRYASALLYAYLGIDRARVFARATNLFAASIYPSWGRPRLPGRSYEFGVSWELVD